MHSENALSESQNDHSFIIVQVAVQGKLGGNQDIKNIPWIIRFHPRRIYYKSWRDDFIGLTSGTEEFTVIFKDNFINFEVFSIKKRTCFISIQSNSQTTKQAKQLQKIMKKLFPTMAIKLNES